MSRLTRGNIKKASAIETNALILTGMARDERIGMLTTSPDTLDRISMKVTGSRGFHPASV
jgi:hypothetical protein